ncbi:MAG: cyclopropane-fatty-acyl-phospholipid synthase family protein [Pseudomonadota bacterium]
MNSISTTLDIHMLPRIAKPWVSLLDRIAEGTLTLTTPTGQIWRFGEGGGPNADLQLSNWAALRTLFRHGDIGLAECYRDGSIDTSDPAALIRLGIRNQDVLERAIHGSTLLNLVYRLKHVLRRNSRRGSARNISAHYDLGNDFYELWLDPSMTYSAARFDAGSGITLLQAQQAKYQRMIDLVGACPGDSLLEIGCGWGGFAVYAARQGIRVHGVTLSRRQLTYARERIGRAGLGALASFELRDYRDLNETYDHIVSIEMLEAVGEAYWPTYFDKLQSLLKPQGRVAIQTIVIGDEHFARYRQGTDFIQQYIFPGGMLPAPGRLQELAGAAGFRIGCYEAFGSDYAETLRRWRRAFEASLGAVRQLGFDTAFIRLWRFYLAYCEAGFDEGRIDVAQLQLVREA